MFSVLVTFPSSKALYPVAAAYSTDTILFLTGSVMGFINDDAHISYPCNVGGKPDTEAMAASISRPPISKFNWKACNCWSVVWLAWWKKLESHPTPIGQTDSWCGVDQWHFILLWFGTSNLSHNHISCWNLASWLVGKCHLCGWAGNWWVQMQCLGEVRLHHLLRRHWHKKTCVLGFFHWYVSPNLLVHVHYWSAELLHTSNCINFFFTFFFPANTPREEIKSYVVITSMQWTYLVEHGLHTTEGLRIVRKQSLQN